VIFPFQICSATRSLSRAGVDTTAVSIQFVSTRYSRRRHRYRYRHRHSLCRHRHRHRHRNRDRDRYERKNREERKLSYSFSFSLVNKKGKHSFYTRWRGLEIMFHVSSLLPYAEWDENKLQISRVIGKKERKQRG
jgi:hypothetical protein